ncbi:hypothetical protein GCM10027299_38390 [Larkinella ripae]
MKKTAYQYLFGQETLYQAVDPKPLVPRRSPAVEVVVQPEAIREETVAEPEPETVETEFQPAVFVPEPTPEPLASAVVEPVAPPAPVPVLEPSTPNPAAGKPKVLILIDEELSPSELIFLENILKAIHLNLNEIDILNLAGSGLVDFHAVLENKTLHHFISFGVPFKTIHLNIQMDRYEPIRIFGITFLLADPLSAIEADQKLKRKLWATLKKVFLD